MEYMNIVANIELILLRGEFIVQYRTVQYSTLKSKVLMSEQLLCCTNVFHIQE